MIKLRRWISIGMMVGLGFVLLGGTINAQGNAANSKQEKKESRMTMHAKGTFEVKLVPQAAEDEATAKTLGRMTIDKVFHGDIEGTSKGQMLTGMSAVQGSGAYVAIEQVTGTVGGKTGSFILMHHGTMARGVYALSVTVVPDSGTGELTGIEGKLDIRIEGKQHFYEFEYSLPAGK